MTLSEFKAWFEGYTENIDKAPTQKQWARIKERVGEIDGQPVTERIYIDRYWPPYRPYQPYWYYSTCGVETSAAAYTPQNVSNNVYTVDFNSVSAMRALGAAEAVQEAA